MFFSNANNDLVSKMNALNKCQAVIEFNLDGTIIDANENFLNTLGYRLDEIKGKHHSMFVDRNYVATTEYKDFWAKLNRGEFFTSQYKRFGKGGKEVWIEASYNPMFNKAGKPYRVVKFAIDITANKMHLTDLEGQLAAIHKSQAVIEFQMDGTIVTANENFLKTLGYTLAEIKGKHHSMFAEPAYAASSEYREFWAKLNRGEFQAAQYKRIGKGGKEVWIEASYNPIFNPDGKPYKVVKFATDITKQVELIASVQKLVSTNVGEIDAAVQTVSQQATSAAGASHQTSTNVQAVASGAEELHASVVEISQNMTRSRAEADTAYQKAENADEVARQLAEAAKSMTGIVDLIRDITEKVNLLSLNATIEAARAGEAGKGFAVVATEVKNLAAQAAQAADQISKEIDGMQGISGAVVNALAEIRQSINVVREYVGGVAAAVEEQSAVARDMSANMQSASQAVSEISANIGAISSATDIAANAVESTKNAAASLAK